MSGYLVAVTNETITRLNTSQTTTTSHDPCSDPSVIDGVPIDQALRLPVMSLPDPIRARPFDMAEPGDHMDLAESSTRSPIMQDIDIDLDFGDDVEPIEEDENMMEDDVLDQQLDLDDEMVDETGLIPPADKTIQSAPAPFAEGSIPTTYDVHLDDPEGSHVLESGSSTENSHLARDGGHTSNEQSSELGGIFADGNNAVEAIEPVVDGLAQPLAERDGEAIATNDGHPQAGEAASVQNVASRDATTHATDNSGEELQGDGDFQSKESNELSHISGDDGSAASSQPHVSEAEGKIDEAQANQTPRRGEGESTSDANETRELSPGSSMGNGRHPTNPAKLRIHTQSSDDTILSGEGLLHPVTILYQGSEMPLFPPAPDTEHSDAYFLGDTSLAGRSIGTLLSACRSVLDDDIGQGERLVMRVPAFGLEIHEGFEDANGASLSQLIETFLQLHRNGGVESPGPMELTLSTQRCLRSSLESLQTAAEEGKTLHEVLVRASDRTSETYEALDPTDNHLGLSERTDPEELAPGTIVDEGEDNDTSRARSEIQGSRATPPPESHLETEFALDFESPLKPSSTSAAAKGQAKAWNAVNEGPANGLNFQAGQSADDSSNAIAGVHDHRPEQDDPLEAPEEGDDLLTNETADTFFDDELDALNEQTEEQFQEEHEDPPLPHTNPDSASIGRNNTVTTRELESEHEIESGEDLVAFDEPQPSTFEEDFVFDDGDEGAALLDASAQPVLAQDLLASTDEYTLQESVLVEEENFDASSLLDEAAFDENDEEQAVMQPPKDVNDAETGFDNAPARNEENRKRSHAVVDDEASGDVDIGHAKRRRPS